MLAPNGLLATYGKQLVIWDTRPLPEHDQNTVGISQRQPIPILRHIRPQVKGAGRCYLTLPHSIADGHGTSLFNQVEVQVLHS